MKAILKYSLILGLMLTLLNSCRNTSETDDEQTELEQMMNDPENKVEIKDGGDKIKIETKDGDQIKIKKEDGDYKKKVETAEGEEYKLKIDEDGEVKEKTDN
ncbi:hypothetical protein [Christiangramia flava]|uniref:Uncharacterized protein n=1 Tax=Christiangramia flava JLT2011 TaxID=1229726 RepID=A0A1L7I7K3_9FLAO|nr:hypothetical protein [Christiangramia flava]APU69591.1 hypothetical protein GRFL_2867 [Christiangramia flava JLT2011]OSS39377.1 membrane or secreted protein [Christiangramia flava JLT2011]